MREAGGGPEDDEVMLLLARRLAAEAGISEREAHGLIQLIGTDWSSLLREARFLKNQR
ncbi:MULTISPECIES: hypothetical protein [unclassified Mesorhizobium]|uniref:hypothetical protein n=1 Tax=unclassified Mesorhizobium TaxID=325217 RepID=UPI0015E30F5B|nr:MULTISPECIES: hypothetical protein [unclassified Mesorhizobium]MBZ9701725.1 hypothetical protein [Mesorhizobium sp. CO1-1-3]MBZ9949073.1 hypothetical protein [Mesorhizobium sp. BR1-1-11]